MKKAIFLLLLFSHSLIYSQQIYDSTQLRENINATFRANGQRAITGDQLGRALNGLMNQFKPVYDKFQPALNWGNHSGLYKPINYIPTWEEITGKPTFDITNWNTAYTWGNHAGLYRPISYVPTWEEISGKPLLDITNWNTAYTWGNHAGLYRPISYIPTWEEISGKPLLDITNWNTAYSWGNHAGLYRPISYVPTWAEISDKPSLDISNWNTAYSWGNHAGLYRPISYVPSWSDILLKPDFTKFQSGISVGSTYYANSPPTNGGIFEGSVLIGTTTDNGVDKLQVNGTARASNGPLIGGVGVVNKIPYFNSTNTLTTSSGLYYQPWDGQFVSQGLYSTGNIGAAGNITAAVALRSTAAAATGEHFASFLSDGALTRTLIPVSSITNTTIANWNTAYTWGNHAGLYRPLSYVPAWSEITGKPTGTERTIPHYNNLGELITNTSFKYSSTNRIDNYNTQIGPNGEFGRGDGSINLTASATHTTLRSNYGGNLYLYSTVTGKVITDNLKAETVNINNAVYDGTSKLETQGNVRNVGTNTASQMIHGSWWPNMTGYSGNMTILGNSTTYLHKVSESVTWTLETATGHNRYSIIRKVGTGTLTLVVQSGDSIILKDGSTVTTVSLTSTDGAFHLQSDGVNTYYQL